MESETTPPGITFTATLTGDGQMSGIPLPFNPRDVFGRARPPVVVTIQGHRYRSTVAIMSERTFVPLRRSHREAAGVEQAGTYEVTLTLDTDPREVAVPEMLATALDAADARAGWDALSFTARRELVEAIATAKRADTRARRVAAAVAAARAKGRMA